MIDILIQGNDRLKFKNSIKSVKDFITKRLDYFRVDSFKFIEKNELERSILDSLKTKSDYVIIYDIMNPFIDFDLINYAIEYSNNYKINFLKPVGHVGGTGFNFFINNNSKDLLEGFNLKTTSFSYFEYKSQSKYNNQLNLYKYKRLKLFLRLIIKNKSLYKYNIDQVSEYLDKKYIYEYLSGFGEDVKLERYEKCPHCTGKLYPLYNSQSQPMVGYVSSIYPHYVECKGCNLILSNPRISPSDIHKIYDEWDKQDFVKSTNNPYNDDSRRCDFSKIGIETNKPQNILDLGGGEGNFSKYILKKYKNWVINHSDYSLKLNIHDDIKSFELDFTNQKIKKNEYNIITAWEVIEHVPYEKLVFVFDNIFDGLKEEGVFIFSTPNYDSPLIKILDFYSVALPFHYTILSEIWLDSYIDDFTKFKVIKKDHTSDFLDDYKNWFDYAINSSKDLKEVSLYKTLIEILNFKHDETKNFLLDKGYGTEIIYFLKKTNDINN